LLRVTRLLAGGFAIFPLAKNARLKKNRDPALANYINISLSWKVQFKLFLLFQILQLVAVRLLAEKLASWVRVSHNTEVAKRTQATTIQTYSIWIRMPIIAPICCFLEEEVMTQFQMEDQQDHPLYSKQFLVVRGLDAQVFRLEIVCYNQQTETISLQKVQVVSRWIPGLQTLILRGIEPRRKWRPTIAQLLQENK